MHTIKHFCDLRFAKRNNFALIVKFVSDFDKFDYGKITEITARNARYSENIS